jgi:hypothetical protein
MTRLILSFLLVAALAACNEDEDIGDNGVEDEVEEDATETE